MKGRDIVFVVGGFMGAFGGVILTSDVDPWAWWTGKAMVILSPLIMSVLGFNHKEPPKT
jgi:hypothetical protein